MHHSTICWNPGWIVTVAVPGRTHRVTLRINFLGLPKLRLHHQDRTAMSLGLFNISRKIHTLAKHTIWRWIEAIIDDGLSIRICGAVVHLHGSATSSMPTMGCSRRPGLRTGCCRYLAPLALFHHSDCTFPGRQCLQLLGLHLLRL